MLILVRTMTFFDLNSPYQTEMMMPRRRRGCFVLAGI
jgi:hypothetical protein